MQGHEAFTTPHVTITSYEATNSMEIKLTTQLRPVYTERERERDRDHERGRERGSRI